MRGQGGLSEGADLNLLDGGIYLGPCRVGALLGFCAAFHLVSTCSCGASQYLSLVYLCLQCDSSQRSLIDRVRNEVGTTV